MTRTPPGSAPADPRLRFLQLVEGPRPDASTCWLWTGTTSKGYGQFSIQVQPGTWRQVKAHRFSYETFIGQIPAGLQLDHLCRVPSCVNPLHLEPVTNRENGLRGISFAARNAVKTHCPQGHAYDERNTMTKLSEYGHQMRECRACHLARMERRRDAALGRTDHQCATCGRFMANARGLAVHSFKVHGVDVKPHGTRSKYVSGCRCDLCRVANRQGASA